MRLLTALQVERIEGLLSERAQAWVRGSRRYEGLLSRQLPAELIVPIIREALSTKGQREVEGLVGLPMRTLFRIVNDCAGVGFPTADRIVIGLLGPEAWQQPPLRSWYWSHGAVLIRQPWR